MALLEIRAPGVVAGARHGVCGPRDFPAAKVLGADREAQVFGTGGQALLEIGSAFLGVVQFVRGFEAVDGGEVGVLGVRRVDGR